MQDEQVRKDNEYWEKLRDDGCGAKKNQSLVAYDITSLGYHQTLKGEQARYDDDMGMISSYYVACFALMYCLCVFLMLLLLCFCSPIPRRCQNPCTCYQGGLKVSVCGKSFFLLPFSFLTNVLVLFRATYNIINGGGRDIPQIPDPVRKPNAADFQPNGQRW
jgi:hypothetical protein